MGVRFSNHIRIFLIALVATLSLQCSRSTELNGEAQGGQGTGGGFVPYSTKDQVNAALDQAIRLASEPDPQKNVIVQFWLASGKTSQYAFIKNPVHLFPKLNPANFQNANFIILGDIPSNDQFDSPALKTISKNKLTRLDHGDCALTKDGLHKDASVSAFSTNGDLCFSLGNLTRIPPSTLLREVLSLVVHEATHLSGVEDEDEAIAWQNEFSSYFGTRFGSLAADTVTTPTLKALSEIRVLLSRAHAMAEKDPGSPQIFGRVGKIAQGLLALPYYDDRLALELKLRPPHPELIANYTDSVNALIQSINGQFDIQYKTAGPMIRISSLKVSPGNIIQMLDEISRSLDQITENFLAFSSDSTEAKSSPISNPQLPTGEATE